MLALRPLTAAVGRDKEADTELIRARAACRRVIL